MVNHATAFIYSVSPPNSIDMSEFILIWSMKWANFKKVLEFWIKACIREDFFLLSEIFNFLLRLYCGLQRGLWWLVRGALIVRRQRLIQFRILLVRQKYLLRTFSTRFYLLPCKAKINRNIFSFFYDIFLTYRVTPRDVSCCAVHQTESGQAALSTGLHKTCSLLFYKMWKLIFDYCRTRAELKRDFSPSSSQWATVCPKLVLLFQPHCWVEIGWRDYCMR